MKGRNPDILKAFWSVFLGGDLCWVCCSVPLPTHVFNKIIVWPNSFGPLLLWTHPQYLEFGTVGTQDLDLCGSLREGEMFFVWVRTCVSVIVCFGCPGCDRGSESLGLHGWAIEGVKKLERYQSVVWFALSQDPNWKENATRLITGLMYVMGISFGDPPNNVWFAAHKLYNV